MKGMARIEGWEAKLYQAVAEARGRAFEWGRHDCALFAADVVERLTGRDYAAPFRGYRNAFGALRRVVRAGGMHALATAALGPPIDPRYARRGDLVLVASQTGGWQGAFAICLDHRGAVGAGLTGLCFVPQACWQAAWRVG